MLVNIFFSAPVAAAQKPTVAALKKTVLAALGLFAAHKGEVNLVFVDNAEITRLNKQFLGKNRATDVIAFSYPAAAGLAEPPFGDIYVSVAQAAAQAAELGHTQKTELFMLAAHGALHLAGYDDATPDERTAMNGVAEKIIRRFDK